MTSLYRRVGRWPAMTPMAQPLQIGSIVFILCRQALPAALGRHMLRIVNRQTKAIGSTGLAP